MESGHLFQKAVAEAAWRNGLHMESMRQQALHDLRVHGSEGEMLTIKFLPSSRKARKEIRTEGNFMQHKLNAILNGWREIPTARVMEIYERIEPHGA